MTSAKNTTWGFFLINLDRSPDRLDVQKEQFKRLGLEFHRVPAVDGNTLPEDLPGLDQRGYDFRHGKSINPNELGCYLSHYNAISAFMESDLEYAVILEDDAGLNDQTEQVIEKLIENSDLWDVVNLSGRHSGMPVRQKKLSDQHYLVAYFFRRTGAAAYLINRKAGQKYRDKLLPMKVPYDHEFDRAWIYGFRYRGVNPSIVKGLTVAASTIGYKKKARAGGVKKSQWRRGSVLLYRTWNETARVLHYLIRGLFIPRT